MSKLSFEVIQQSYWRDPKEVGGFANIMECELGNTLSNALECIAEELFCSNIEESDAKKLHARYNGVPVELFMRLRWIDLLEIYEPVTVIRLFMECYY